MRERERVTSSVLTKVCDYFHSDAWQCPLHINISSPCKALAILKRLRFRGSFRSAQAVLHAGVLSAPYYHFKFKKAGNRHESRKSACRQLNTMMQASPSMRHQASPSDTAAVVVITGVSRGLGRALALELAQRGYTVVGCGRNEEKLLELEKSLSGGSKHLLKKVDVVCDSSVKEFAQTVMEAKGAPAIVINFAGIINRNGKLWELSAAEFDAVVDINIKGAANVMRHFLPLMMRQGLLVNITSGWGRIGAADVAPYCASKWAIEGLTQAVAKEVPQGVTVVALNPGVVNTDMLVSCFGSQAALYQSPDTWAPLAADVILNLTAGDNGASLNV